MTVKTVVEVKELLKDLSGFTSLSSRVQTECKEAVSVLDKVNQAFTPYAPPQVASTKPKKVCDHFKETTIDEIIRRLNDINSKFELINVCIVRASFGEYFAYYQALTCPPIRQWTYKRIPVTSKTDMLVRLQAWPNEVELLYVLKGGVCAVIRER